MVQEKLNVCHAPARFSSNTFSTTEVDVPLGKTFIALDRRQPWYVSAAWNPAMNDADSEREATLPVDHVLPKCCRPAV